MPGRGGLTARVAAGAGARRGAAVTVECYSAETEGDNPAQTTPETILSGILRTPTVWMDFDAEPGCELELPLPLTQRRLAPQKPERRYRHIRGARGPAEVSEAMLGGRRSGRITRACTGRN